MPIDNVSFHGNWGDGMQKPRYGYQKSDIGILQSPAGMQKIHQKFQMSNHHFDFYFVRSPQAYKQGENGLVTAQWVKENLKIDIQPREGTVSVLFVNNKGDEKMPMTAWTLAHRIGHALRRTERYQVFYKEVEKMLNDIMKQVYGHQQASRSYYSYSPNDSKSLANEEINKKALCHAIGTMKSARDANISRSGEFAHELFAQYMMTGKITFNPIPKQVGPSAWGRQPLWVRDSNEFEQWNDYLPTMADILGYSADNALIASEEQIFVM